LLRLKKTIGFSLLGAYVIVMMSFVNVAYNEKRCNAIEVVIEDSIGTHFVQQSDILHILKKGEYDILSKVPNEINLHIIENDIKNHSSIKDCDCYFTSGGKMRIIIEQRHPIARVITKKYDFYIDDVGAEMPPSRFYTAHVPIITGYVTRDMVATDLFKIADLIHNNNFWEAQIEQINVDQHGEYALIPRAGRQVIELGDANNLEVKFKSLEALYLQIFNNNSWNKYKTISLKYDGQVVCTKK
jgi:cell division protein FtsQ